MMNRGGGPSGIIVVIDRVPDASHVGLSKC